MGGFYSAPFYDRHEDPDVVAHRKEWVTKMIELKPRLSVLNVSTGKPEWPNLPPGTIPPLHGNHDEAMLYANDGNHFAWGLKGWLSSQAKRRWKHNYG